jgi:hypothetical protein
VSQQILTRLIVQAQPNARQNEVTNFAGGILHIRIAAPPVKGKANEELIKFFGRLLGISRDNIKIEKGMTSKRKVIAINGLSQAESLERLGIQ